MNINAFNFDSLANTNDGSCIPFIYGCTDELANNYNPIANTDNESCIYPVSGCTNPLPLIIILRQTFQMVLV